MTMAGRISAVLMLAMCSAAAWAQQEAPAKPPILVELFTAEECSSCPPADALLKQMDGNLSPSGQTVIALSEHVTYWNHDGWTDPFSQELFTERQKTYQGRFGLSDVYTPQLVVNGDQQVAGGDGPAILKALTAQPAAAAVGVKILSAKADGNGYDVTFAVTGALPKRGADVFAVVAQNEASSNVARGENKGRTLTHVSVARTLTKVATLKAGETRTVKVPRGDAPAGAPEHLVLFAQTTGQGPVLDVASSPL